MENPVALTGLYFVLLSFVHALSDILSTQFFPHYRNYAPKKKEGALKPSLEELALYRGKEQLNWNMSVRPPLSCSRPLRSLARSLARPCTPPHAHHLTHTTTTRTGSSLPRSAASG